MSSETKSQKQPEKVAKEEESNPFGGSTISSMLQLGKGKDKEKEKEKDDKENKATEDQEAEEQPDEEECSAQFQPIVQLDEVETQTGEESEEVKFERYLNEECKCKLYRFDNKANEWKERGTGQAKILEHKESKRIRMIMRQEKTLKLRANHIVVPTTLSEHQGSDKAFVWTTADYSDGELKYELLCIRFGTPEKAANFKKEYEAAMEVNKKLLKLDEGSALKDEKSKEQDESKQDANDLADKLKEKVQLNSKESDTKQKVKSDQAKTESKDE